jgi:hypothetical protein
MSPAKERKEKLETANGHEWARIDLLSDAYNVSWFAGGWYRRGLNTLYCQDAPNIAARQKALYSRPFASIRGLRVHWCPFVV